MLWLNFVIAEPHCAIIIFIFFLQLFSPRVNNYLIAILFFVHLTKSFSVIQKRSLFSHHTYDMRYPSSHSLSTPPCSKLDLLPYVPATQLLWTFLCYHSRNSLCFSILLGQSGFTLTLMKCHWEISCRCVQSGHIFTIPNAWKCIGLSWLLIYNWAGYRILSWKTFLSKFLSFCHCPPSSSVVEI